MIRLLLFYVLSWDDGFLYCTDEEEKDTLESIRGVRK